MAAYISFVGCWLGQVVRRSAGGRPTSLSPLQKRHHRRTEPAVLGDDRLPLLRLHHADRHVRRHAWSDDRRLHGQYAVDMSIPLSQMVILARPLQVTVLCMLRDRCPVCPVLSVSLSVTLVYGGRVVGWIKMPFGTEVGLSPDDIAFSWRPAPPRKGAQQPPLFGPCL